MLAQALERLEFEEEHGDPAVGRAALDDLAARFASAAEQLLGSGHENQALIDEIRPWVEVFCGRCGAAARAARRHLERRREVRGFPASRGLRRRARHVRPWGRWLD